mmetsp:Transcript_64820/g.174000  ORF Transcript_64820/g.174000 Transcript_64820/m.174000 type:complete len:87 (+) Transcript_64820:215-475(+)
MDATLSTLKACKHLALSSNNIEKITGLKGCERLEILSLGRNQIKKLDGLNFDFFCYFEIHVDCRQVWKMLRRLSKSFGSVTTSWVP